MVKPFNAFADWAKSALEAMRKRFERVNARLQGAKNKLKNADAKCRSLEASLLRKKQACNSILLSALTQTKTSWGMRRRWWAAAKEKAGKTANAAKNAAMAAAEKAGKAARYAKRKVCLAAVHVIAKSVRAVCQAGVFAAQKALLIVQKAVDAVKYILDKVAAIVVQILDKVREVINLLTKFELVSLGFEGGFESFNVVLKASIRVDGGDVQNYAFNINFKKLFKQIFNFIKQILKKMFKKILDSAMGGLKRLRGMLSGLKMEADAAEEEMGTALTAVAAEEALVQKQHEATLKQLQI